MVNNISRPFFFVIIICLMIAGTSCKEDLLKEKNSEEGVITYKVTFPEYKNNDLLQGMMPSEVKTYFKKNMVRSEMSAGFNLMKTAYILNSENEEIIILMNLLNKKYAVKTTGSELKEERKNMPQYNIKKMGDSKEIAGIISRKALVSTSGTDNEFEVYYTDDFQTNNFNWHTPYEEIEGILLEYPIRQNDIQMFLSATEIKKVAVSDSLFMIPEDYKLITKEEFEQKIHDLMPVGN